MYICFFSFFFLIDYDTDEETDKLLGVEHQIHTKNQAIRDAVSKPTRSREGRLRSFV
jgi:hypothetical protein